MPNQKICVGQRYQTKRDDGAVAILASSYTDQDGYTNYRVEIGKDSIEISSGDILQFVREGSWTLKSS